MMVRGFAFLYCLVSWILASAAELQEIGVKELELLDGAHPGYDLADESFDKFHHILKETASSQTVSMFTKRNRALANHQHDVVFAVKQNNLDKLEQLVDEISHPGPAYGQYLTRDQVTSMVRNSDSAEFLLHFLDHHHLGRVIHRTLGDEYVTVRGTVKGWEGLFGTEFFEYTFNPINSQVHGKQTSRRRIIRAEKYHLPQQLFDHVDAVFRVVQFPDRMPKAYSFPSETTRDAPETALHTTSLSNTCGDGNSYNLGITQPCLLNQLYNIRNNSGGNWGSQAIYADLDQTLSPSDLTEFQQYFGLPIQSIRYNYGGHVNDTTCRISSSDCLEANLDVQYIMGISQSVPTWYYYWNGTGDWDVWLIQVASMAQPPLVLSISYGSYEDSLSKYIISSFQTEAMKLAAMGVTIVAASGDDGVAGFLARGKSSSCGYYPMFPASSPYVTAVGGTQGPEYGNEEVTCQGNTGGVITSGGGFSSVIKAHSWQQAAIASYFANVSANPPMSGYHAKGRGYPDISLLASNYHVKVGGSWITLYGTSASAPVLAGMIALINSQRLRLGLPSLGWINPTLYQYSGNFTRDVNKGNNKCCTLGNPCCIQGFHAVTGWDPATGWGSVNFTAMSEVYVSLALTAATTPTVSPSSSPVPSRFPTIASGGTASPTVSSGYLYSYLYDGESCSGTVVAIEAYPVQVCFPVYGSSSSTVLYYRRYSCSNTQGQSDTFSDSSCSKLLSTTMYDLSSSTPCSDVADSYYYFTGNEIAYSSRMFCSTATTVNSIVPNNGINYFRNISFAGSSCTRQSVIKYTVPSYCYEIGTSDYVYRSFRVVKKTGTALQVQYFTTTQCSGTFSFYTLNTGTCYNLLVAGTILRTVTYSTYQAPTSAPTTTSVSPSTLPTSSVPSISPSISPSAVPISRVPTESPSVSPSDASTSRSPSFSSSTAPSAALFSRFPTVSPCIFSTVAPTMVSSALSTTSAVSISHNPSCSPSCIPTTTNPTVLSSEPTVIPSTSAATLSPSTIVQPVRLPSLQPTAGSTSAHPTSNTPSMTPSATSTNVFPSLSPTANLLPPTESPSRIPSRAPTTNPAALTKPSVSPSVTSTLHPTAAPTSRRPTLTTYTPTTMPTISSTFASSTIVSLMFDVTQSITNLSLSSYSMSSSKYNSLLTTALYEVTVPSLAPTIVSSINRTRDFVVTDVVSTSTAASASMNLQRTITVLSTDSVVVTISIKVPNIADTINGVDMTVVTTLVSNTYDQMIDALTIALVDGNFNTRLAVFNMVVQDMAFSNYTTLIYDSGTGGKSDSADSTSNDAWNEFLNLLPGVWMIIIIAVGGGCILCLCCMLLYGVYDYMSISEDDKYDRSLGRSSSRYMDTEGDEEDGPKEMIPTENNPPHQMQDCIVIHESEAFSQL